MKQNYFEKKLSHSHILGKLKTWLPATSDDSLTLIGAFFPLKEKTVLDPNHASL